MDPLSILGTVLTIAQIANAIKASIDKVKGNKKRLEILVGDIIKSLDDLEKFSKAHVQEVGGSEQLQNAVLKLQRDMADLLTHCHKLIPRNDGSQLSKVKASLKAWSKGDDLEAEMQRIKDSIVSCYAQFTAFAAARAENASYRLENSIVVRGVEHKAHLQRLEVLVTNVLLDTRFGKQVVQQVARVIGVYPTEGRSIEHDYLCMQLDKALDIMEAHPGYQGPIMERPADDFTPNFEPVNFVTVPHEFVVTDILVLSRSVRAASYESIHKVARDIESVAGQLNDLYLFQEAINAQKIVVQLFRNLVGGGCSLYLPNLAHALKNLSVHLQNIGQQEEALLASEDSIAALRLVCDAHPELDFRPLLAMNLRTHGDALALAGKSSSALDIFKESISTYAELIQEIHSGTRTSTFTILFSASSVAMSYSQALYWDGDELKAHRILKLALFYLSLTSRKDLDGHSLWTLPTRLFHLAARILQSLFTDGCSLSLAGEIVDMYRLLSQTDPKRFSSQFLRCLYAYAYLCHFGTPSHPDRVILEAAHCYIFQLVYEESIVHTNEDHPMGHGSFKPVIRALQGSESGIQIIQRAIQAYLTPISNINTTSGPGLAENTHQLIVAFAVLYPQVTFEAVDSLTSSTQVQQGSHNALLLRALTLIRDTSERLDLTFQSQLMPCAQTCMDLGRSCLLDIELPGALVAFGNTLLHCGEHETGISAIEEAISVYRTLSAERGEQREILYSMMNLSDALRKAGRTVEAFQCYQELLQLCIELEELGTFQDVARGPLVTTLLLICEHLLTFKPQRSYQLAQYAHHLLSSLTTTLPSAHSSLYAVLIQCLRLAGVTDEDILDADFSHKVYTAFEGRVETTFRIQDQFEAYEHLIHFRALQGQSLAVDSIVQRAYSLHREEIGGEISLSALGLRHDTLAIIASHYAKLERAENILPFASAAVVTSKMRSPNLAEDTQYLESMCDVSAYLWNSGQRDEAVVLLESVAEAWKARSELGVLPTDSKPSVDSKNVRDVFGDLAPERFHDDLRAYLATHLLPTTSSTLEKDDDNSGILSYMAKFEALVEEHMEATSYKKRDCAAESSQDTSDAVNPVSQDDVAEDADSRASGDGESMGHSVAPTMLSDPGIAWRGEPTQTQIRCEDESDTPPNVSLTSFSAGAPDLELPSKLSDAPVLTSSATVHPRSDTQRSLIASTKHWVTLVANILVISWTVVFFVVYISPSFGNGSFRLPS